MTKESKVWAAELASILTDIFDPKRGDFVWTNKDGAPNGQFDEYVNLLYDNFLFSEFIEQNPLNYSSDIVIQLKEFSELFEGYLTELDDPIENVNFLKSKKWRSIKDYGLKIAHIMNINLD